MAVAARGRRAGHKPIPTLPPLLFIVLVVPQAVAAQSYCVTDQADNGTQPAFYEGLGQIETPVSIQVDANSAPIDSDETPTGDQLKQGLEEASEAWNGSCGGSNTPDFSMDSGTTRDSSGAGWATSVGVLYHIDLEIPPDGTLAQFHASGTQASPGTLEVYGRCQNTQGELMAAICRQVGPNLYIDWSHPWAVQFLIHELGHALGIGHDRSEGACGAFSGIMEQPVPYREGQIKLEHCEYAEFRNCDAAMGACPEDPGAPKDPIAGLPNLCELLGLLCPSSQNPGGSPAPWWTVPETRPDLICSLNEVPGPEETIQIVEECEYVPKSARRLGTKQASPGPVTAIRAPAEGAVVRGLVSLDGWMREEVSGVTGALGFWIDRQTVYPAAVAYGDADSAGCSGSADPNCPYIGFSASLDTTVLADGVHTLEVVGAQNVVGYPIPAYGKSTFTVDNTRPAVSITSPSQGATLSGTVQVAVSASDTSGIDRVRLVVDGVHQAWKYSPPYTFSWNTLGWADGAHNVRAVAWDEAGNSRQWTTGVTLANDLQVPQVSVTAPAAGSLVRGTVTVKAQATDDQGVAFVEFYVDGASIGTDATAPYQVTWATPGYADGSHTLTARAYDASGNVGIAPAVSVSVDNTLPQLYVDNPSHLEALSGTSVELRGWAIDTSGVASRSIQVNGQPLPGVVQTFNRGTVCNAYPEVADPGCPYVGWRLPFNSTAYSNGSYTLSVTATDAAGNSKTFSRSFVIDNPDITLSFHPVADATAWQAYPTLIDGSSTTLGTRTTSGGQGAYAFLKFQVTGVQGPVTSARLNVKTLSSMTDLWLYWLVHSNWTESNLSWSYFPGPGGTLDFKNNLVAGVWYSFDVSSFVGGNGTFSMGFANSNPWNAFLSSRESSNKPVLEVSYEP